MMQPNMMQMMQFAKAAAPRGPMPGQMPQGGPPTGLMMPGMQGSPPPMMPQGGPGMPPSGGMPGAPAVPGRPAPNPLAAKIGSVIKPVGMAAKGRGGDTMMAHMTPGEIAVPPQVQTPDVLAMLNKAFAQAGANPTSYQAGSPDQKVNPSTGMPEFGFFETVLPMALAAAGSAFLGPEIIPLLGAGGLGLGEATAATLGGSLGGFLGNTAGNLITGQGILPSLAGGAGAGVGSALGGSFGASGGAMNNTPGSTGPSAGTVDAIGSGQTSGLYNAPPDKSFLEKALGGLASKQAMGAAMGGLIPGMLFPQSSSAPTNVNGPPMTPMSQLPPLSNFIGGGSGNSGTAIPFGAQRRPPIGYRPGVDPQHNYFG